MIKLSDHFGYKKLIKFVLPSIAMMIFTSIYGVIDGLFVSNFVGSDPFASINLIMPFLMALGAIGFMLGAGGTAIVSKTMGEGKNDLANKYFSFLIIITIVSGLVISALGELVITKIAYWLGARGENAYLLDDCVIYGRIILLSIPAFMLQNVFQLFYTTAERPDLGFFTTLIAGIANIVIDALLIIVFKMGVKGAAIATTISQCIGGLLPFIYFTSKKAKVLHLTKTSFCGKMLIKTCTNGCSELMTNISASIVSILYNAQLLKLAGPNGVAAYGVLMYVNFMFIAIYIGYSIGIAPIIGFNYGAKNQIELKNVLKKSLTMISICAVCLTVASLLLSTPIAKLFVGKNPELFSLTKGAFLIFSYCFLFSGFNIFGSTFFTALGNGIVSAIISFLRTLVFQIASVLILPLLFGINGIWASIIFAEIMALIVTGIFLVAKRKKYNY